MKEFTPRDDCLNELLFFEPVKKQYYDASRNISYSATIRYNQKRASSP